MAKKRKRKASDERPARLTVRAIDDLVPKAAAQYVLWDGDVAGFGVRVSPAGTKTYILKYRLKSGRVRWKTLGRVEGDITLDEARDRARKDRGLVSDGKDPLQAQDVARGGLTVAAVADRFLRDYVEPRKKPTTLRQYRQVIDAHIRPRLGAVPMAELSTDDVVKLHARLKATPYSANRTIATLSKLCAWATQAKLRPAGPNPCLGIEKYGEQARKRYLDADEYARVGKAIRDARRAGTMAPAPLTAIELLLLTGARPAEVASLKWTHVDLSGAALRLPDSKTGAKTIYLPPAAVRLLKTWPRWAGSDYVFPGMGRRQKGDHMHPTTLAHAWQVLREAAALEDVRLYDACRHSFASMAVSKHGLSLAAIGEQLGHSQAATTKRYAHLHDAVARGNATAVGGSIATAMKRRAK